MPPRLHLRCTPSQSLFLTRSTTIQTTLLPVIASRTYAMKSASQKRREMKEATRNKKKATKTTYTTYDLKDADQYTLVEAMRYIKAFEVGRDPVATKIDLAVKLKTVKNGPTVKNRLKLPRPVKTDLKICVFAEGKAAEDAVRAGASLVGSEELWERIKAGTAPEFDRCLCHIGVFPAFSKHRLGRILGPKGLMPSQKAGTVVPDVTKAVKDLVGASEYRERLGVVRMAVGQLGFTTKELSNNIKAFIDSIKFAMGRIDKIEKSIHEVVLSSTRSPGFSLTGEVRKQKKANVGSAVRETAGETMTADDVVDERPAPQMHEVPVIEEPVRPSLSV